MEGVSVGLQHRENAMQWGESSRVSSIFLQAKLHVGWQVCYDTTPLHPRIMWETNVGTPPGNTSIATFFGRTAVPQQLELEEVTTTGEEDEEDEGDGVNVI